MQFAALHKVHQHLTRTQSSSRVHLLGQIKRWVVAFILFKFSAGLKTDLRELSKIQTISRSTRRRFYAHFFTPNLVLLDVFVFVKQNCPLQVRIKTVFAKKRVNKWVEYLANAVVTWSRTDNLPMFITLTSENAMFCIQLNSLHHFRGLRNSNFVYKPRKENTLQ